MKKSRSPKSPSQDQLKKHRKCSDCYALVTNYSKSFKPSTDKYAKVFIMKIKQKPIGIAFYTFENSQQRNELIDSRLSKMKKITFSYFDDINFLNTDSTLHDFEKVASLAEKEILNLHNELSNPDVQSNIEKLEKSFKITCRQILWRILPFLEVYFFMSNDLDDIENKWTDQVFMAHVLLGCLSYFLLKNDYKNILIKLKSNARYLRTLLNNVITYKGTNDFSKIFIVDILYQLVFLKNQFNNEPEIWSFLFQGEIDGNTLKIISVELFNQIFEIFCLAHMKIAPQMTILNYKQFIENCLNKVYIVSLPASLSGLTCFNSNILIRNPDPRDINLVYFPSKAFILLAILHELGNVMQRLSFRLKSEWFDHDSLKTPSTSIAEAGDNLIISIFGSVLKEITYYGSLYICEPLNWKKQKKVFKNEFLEENKKLTQRSTPENRTHCLKQADTRYSISLGQRCKRQCDY